MHRIPVIALIILMLAVPISGFAQSATPSASPSAASGDFSGLVDIGGRNLYLECRGEGSPTVILESGAGGRADVWSRDLEEPEGERTMVLPGVAEFTRVCAYDRPGTMGEVNPSLDPYGPLFYPSRSDPVPQPRTAQDMVDDLHALVDAAAIPGPYVLVAHSAGGLVARLYASEYPNEVVGMVLLDSTHEDVWLRFQEALTPEQWEVFEAITVTNQDLLDAYPEAERWHTAPLADEATSAQVRQARKEAPLHPMPLVVLMHGIPFGDPFPGWPAAKMEAIMHDLQEDLATLVPNAHFAIATESGHNIHQDQPDLVIEAIRDVVDAIHDPSTWTSQAEAPIATSGDFAGLVDIGGRKIYLECHGQGSPTVILVAGGSSSARYWTDDLLHPDAPRTMVMPAVAKFTRVCAYDRPGTYAFINDEIFPSRSDAVTQPRTVTEMVDELHALLQAAGISGPYVLAGHSNGGFISRLYAATYPDEVIGLILIDAYSELLQDTMPPEKWQALVRLNQELGSDVVHQIPGYGDAESTGYGTSDAVVREAVAASPLPPLPLAVFAHGKPFSQSADAPGFAPGELERYLLAANEAQAALVPNARFTIASKSGHDIHQDQPELVIEAIRQVVAGVRNPDTWYDLASCCAE
jgi:pimeloyl-ACP methyl ester carboxylesterase